MAYIEYNFSLSSMEPWREIFLALLSQIEFDSFEDTDNGFKAYILNENDDPEFVQNTINQLNEVQISFHKTKVKPTNWNEEWEKNFRPINVEDKCYIRAEFHEPNPKIPYEIVIQPKMSFGTGHHETTYLIIQYLLEMNLEGKDVLDMGTGTGILAILAKMKGANYVEGIDIDEWAYTNAKENVERNKVDVTIKEGGAEQIPDRKFDLVIANINKNILLRDIPQYVKALQPNGELILSGLYKEDKPDILTVTKQNGLKFVDEKTKNNWIALHFNHE